MDGSNLLVHVCSICAHALHGRSHLKDTSMSKEDSLMMEMEREYSIATTIIYQLVLVNIMTVAVYRYIIVIGKLFTCISAWA